MERHAEHVGLQLRNGQTMFKYLLEFISCSNAGLYAAIAMIRNNDGPVSNLSKF